MAYNLERAASQPVPTALRDELAQREMTELPRKLEKQGSIIDRLHAEERASADEARGGGKRPTHAGRKGSQIEWEDLEQQFRETLHVSSCGLRLLAPVGVVRFSDPELELKWRRYVRISDLHKHYLLCRNIALMLLLLLASAGSTLFYTYRRVLQLDADILDSDSSSGETGETSEGLSDDAVATLSLERGLAAHRRYLALLFTLLFGVHLLVSIVLLVVFRSADRRARERGGLDDLGGRSSHTFSAKARAATTPVPGAGSWKNLSDEYGAKPISRSVSAGDHAAKASSFGPRRGEVETFLDFRKVRGPLQSSFEPALMHEDPSNTSPEA